MGTLPHGAAIQWSSGTGPVGPRLLDLRRVPRIPDPSCGCGHSVGQTRDEAADYWDPPIEDRGLARAWALPMARGTGHWALGCRLPHSVARQACQPTESHEPSNGPRGVLGAGPCNLISRGDHCRCECVVWWPLNGCRKTSDGCGQPAAPLGLLTYGLHMHQYLLESGTADEQNKDTGQQSYIWTSTSI